MKPKTTLHNVLTLMTGTTISQAIPILVAPILTRLYTPEDFGIFALYMSVTAIVSSFISGKYELAILLPNSNKEAFNIFILSISIVSAVSIILFMLIYFFDKEIISILGIQNISTYLYLIPITAFLTGIFQSFNYWNTRSTKYKTITINKVYQSISTNSVGIGIGYSGYCNSGLLLSHIFGQFIAVFLFVLSFFKNDYQLLKECNKKQIFQSIGKYKDFPKYNMPHSLLNNISANLPILLLNQFFNSANAGFFSLAEKVILSPLSIVGASYSQVFYQEISDLYQDEDRGTTIGKLFKKTVTNMFIFILPIAVLFFFISPSLFSFVFGSEWGAAGIYSQILTPMLFVRFIGGIVSPIVIVFEKQFCGFIIEIVNTLIGFLALLVGIMSNDFILGLILYSFSRTIISIGRLYWYSRIIQ